MIYKIGDEVEIKNSAISAPDGIARVDNWIPDIEIYRIVYVEISDPGLVSVPLHYTWNARPDDIIGYSESFLNRIKAKKALGL